MTSRATAFPELPSTVSERTVPALLRRAAKDAPDRCALVAHSLLSGDEASLSYRELVERSGRFAAALADRGVTHGDRVALLVGNDGALEAHLAYHAVHRLGAINVPVNTFYLERELEYVVGFSALPSPRHCPAAHGRRTRPRCLSCRRPPGSVSHFRS